MIEEQIEIEVLFADLEVILVADEGEALAEFDDQRLQVLAETALARVRRDRPRS